MDWLFSPPAVVSGLVGVLLHLLGYRAGWRACYRKHTRTVTAVDPGSSSVTISSEAPPVGARIWFP